ncbi:MAG: RodZ domain-containing protein [Chloroflexota bacterium]
MSELGQWLRQAREAKEFSLEKAEAETRIRIKFLAALEEGHFDDLPDEISARGFLRNYALFLGLDPTEALEKYEHRTVDRRGEPRLFRPLEVALFHSSGGALRAWLLLLTLAAALITTGIWAFSSGRLAWPPRLAWLQPTAIPSVTATPTDTPTRPPRPSITLPATAAVVSPAVPSATPTANPTPSPTATNSILTLPTPTPSPSSTPTVTPTSAPTGGTPLPPGLGTPIPPEEVAVSLAIVVREESWVEVTVDSHTILRELFQAGDEGFWQARREIILRLGNAGGVEVILNGELLGALGERGQVVEFAWGQEGQVTPEPTFTATATPEETPTPEATSAP